MVRFGSAKTPLLQCPPVVTTALAVLGLVAVPAVAGLAVAALSVAVLAVPARASGFVTIIPGRGPRRLSL